MRRRGFDVHAYEINNGLEFDLTNPANLKRLARDARRGRLRGMMVSITCVSWSQARNRTNVIRTRLQPWGVTNPPKPFSERDVFRLAEGNLQLRRLLPLLRVCVRHHTPFCLENPASSNIWFVPDMLRLLAHPRVELVTIDQCAFGQPWRKRTKFMIVFCDTHDIDELRRYRCQGRGICSFSGKPHVQLTGSDASGRPLTARAQTFPRPLCTKLSNLLTSLILASL